MEVILEGMLERCENTARNIWKKNYFVFQRNFSTGSNMLEYYKDSNWKKQTVSGLYNLYPDFSVVKIDLKNRFAFEITIAEQKHIFSANTENLRKQWVDVLLEAAGVKIFNVKLLDSPPNAYEMLKNFQGTMELHVAKTFVMLLAHDLSKITWRFGIIRRYKSQSFIFTLEVGRKSETGEGIFRFECNRSIELFDVLDKVVKDRIKLKGLMNSPNTKQVEIPKQGNDTVYSHLHKSEADKDKIPDNSYDVLFNAKKHPHFHQAPTSENNQSVSSSCLSLSTSIAEEDQYEAMFSNANCLANNTKTMHIASIPLKSVLTSRSSVHNVLNQEIAMSSLKPEITMSSLKPEIAMSSLNTPEIDEQNYVNMSVGKFVPHNNDANIVSPLRRPINLSLVFDPKLLGEKNQFDHFNATLISSSKAEEEEQYEDMSAGKSLPKKSEIINRPIPAPRIKKPSVISNNIDVISQEYDYLVNVKPELKSNQIQDEYNHLNNITRDIDHFNKIKPMDSIRDYDYPSEYFVSQEYRVELPLKFDHSLDMNKSEIPTQPFDSLDQGYVEIPKIYSDKHFNK